MPIDIAFGTAKLDYEDLTIPGKVPLVWDRRYSTAFLDRQPTPLGRGWICRYFSTLSFVEGRFEFVTPEGGTEVFPDPGGIVARGRVVRNLGAFLEIFRQGDRCIVQSWDAETGDVRRYCFVPNNSGLPWKLSNLEDVTGQGLDVTWDRSGRLQGVCQRLERRELRVAYDKSGMIEGIALHANGERHSVMTYAYDDARQQIEARDAARFADRFEYDDRGRIRREIVRDGGVFHYRYDDKGRCVLRTGLGHYNEKRLKYLDAIRVTEVTDSYDRKFTYHHLPSGQAVLEVDPLGAQRSTQYDEYGRIVAKTDATGATTRCVFDDQGNRSSVVDALGHTTTFTFNGHHQPLSMTDAAGHLWYRGYDSANRLIGAMDPLDNRWSFDYDADSNLIQVTNPKGDRKHHTYRAGVLQSTTDWMGNATHFALDAFGRVIERRGPLEEVTRFRYDAMGNPIQVVQPDGSTLSGTYDQVGNLVRFVDANGHVARWQYGPCMRLLGHADAAGGTVRYMWGSERGHLEKVVNERGETYTFFRDEAGRITREVSFDGSERLFRYDAEGFSIAYTNADGETITMDRDALHRVVREHLPDDGRVTFAFDAIGNLSQAINSEIEVNFERDPLGRIVREVQGDRWVESSYDALGNLIRTATSLGHAADYEVDTGGYLRKLTTVGGARIEFERNARGQETARHMPGGARMDQSYDVAGRLIEQRMIAAGSRSLASQVGGHELELVRRSYSYDGTGALTRVVDGRWGSVEYVYDPAERLLGALRAGGTSEHFEYDATGNLTRMRTDGDDSRDDVLLYGSGNRLLKKGSIRYEHDVEGRRIRKIDGLDPLSAVWSFEWNALHQLKSVTSPTGARWRYRYDALGRRIRKEGPTETSDFIWDRDLCIQEASSGTTSCSWVYEFDRITPLLLIRDGTICTVATDHLGVPYDVREEGGRVVWSAMPEAWGDVTSKRTEGESDFSCSLSFPGFWTDPESGLRYARFRYYDPSTGRFISPDPMRLGGGLNVYSYARNPVNWADPYGLSEDIKPAEYRSPLTIEPGVRRVEVTKISENTGQPYQHVAHYDDHGQLVGQTHYTDHGRPTQHTNPHHHRRDPETGQRLKSPPGSELGAGTRAWPGAHPDEQEHQQTKKPGGCTGPG